MYTIEQKKSDGAEKQPFARYGEEAAIREKPGQVDCALSPVGSGAFRGPASEPGAEVADDQS